MPNVSRLLNKLMEKGLIHKARNISDQRVVHIQLTAKGEQIAKEGRKLFDAVNYQISDEHAQLLNDLLDKMRSSVI